ncbi:MAG: MBL fold metallo-hydrolase [Gammaproteobacteria bacterium]|nr:MBL fold metallo-hydrolase [Gammaproteobacteria bacterium]MBU1732078.1 MBL fold metallo-hydrolase [Gammaproteobacteria bacterium]MBU1893134.1 MBL fold metallo-hydrolase [Gammaproteobacteria bacterium]
MRFLGFLFLLLAASAQAGDIGAPDNMLKPIKASAHCYYVQGLAGAASSANQGFMSNAGFVVTPAGVVVFDSLGTPVLAEGLIRAIRKVTSQPIKRVIVSHYHADHIYGLQAFKAIGAEIWAHQGGKEYLASEEAPLRMKQRREDLFPWVDEKTRLLSADRWLSGDENFELGGLHFSLHHVGPAHSSEDMAMLVKEDGVLFTGDLIFKGRVPYVGDADSAAWLKALDRLATLKPSYLIPGHGAAAPDAAATLQFTRQYLQYLRQTMGRAVENFVPFEEAYAGTSWKKYEKMPAFHEANRSNAYNTYLLMEKESIERPK